MGNYHDIQAIADQITDDVNINNGLTRDTKPDPAESKRIFDDADVRYRLPPDSSYAGAEATTNTYLPRENRPKSVTILENGQNSLDHRRAVSRQMRASKPSPQPKPARPEVKFGISGRTLEI